MSMYSPIYPTIVPPFTVLSAVVSILPFDLLAYVFALLLVALSLGLLLVRQIGLLLSLLLSLHLGYLCTWRSGIRIRAHCRVLALDATDAIAINLLLASYNKCPGSPMALRCSNSCLLS